MEGVGGEPIESVRGDGNSSSARYKIRRIAQQVRLRGLCIDAQQFSWQFFGLWRSRDATLQRPAGAALIWATLPHPFKPRNISLLPPRDFEVGMLPCAGSALTQSARGPTIAAIELLSLLKSLLSGHPFPRGTLCAFVGFAFIALSYRHPCHKLLTIAQPPTDPLRLEFTDCQSWPELRYLQIGAALSVAVFVLAGAAAMG